MSGAESGERQAAGGTRLGTPSMSGAAARKHRKLAKQQNFIGRRNSGLRHKRLEFWRWPGERFVHGEHFSLLIWPTRPEKTSQAVAALSRNDVDVQMRHALADDVVDGDKGAFRLHNFLHFSSEHLSVREKRTD